MTPALLDHLWQSTLFSGGAWLMTLWLRRNPARLRFRLWFAASVKFLVPFAALSALGESLSRLFPATVPQLVLEIRPAAERLSAPVQALAAGHHTTTVNPMPLLVCLWLAGFAVVLVLRLTRWLRLRAVMRKARDVEIAVPVDVKESDTLLEPGLVGILRPVVLLPEGLMPHLSTAERDAILAHELSHFSSGDNITAAIHMLVEALFWFWPPVWLIGGRLIAERERACDESVLADGHDAEVYAQAILKVCRFCIQSPLPCASGASGADLSVRVRQIMSGERVSKPGRVRRAMLATAMILVLALPVTEGFVRAPPLMAEMQQRVAAVKFQVAARIVRAATQVRQITAAPVAPARARHRPRWKAVAPPQELPPQEQRMAALPPTPPDTPVADVPAPPAPAALPVPASVTSPVRAAIKDVLVALYPQGNGDPDAVTCRLPETLPGSRLPGPKVCQTNRQWASLRARHEDITPDGASIILRNGSEQHAGYALLNCAPQRVAGSGIANPLAVPASFCF